MRPWPAGQGRYDADVPDRPSRRRSVVAAIGAGGLGLFLVFGWIADATAVVDLVRSSWSWMSAHGAIGWSIALVLVVVLVVLARALVYHHRVAASQVSALRGELNSATADRSLLVAELEGPRPTERDIRLAAEVLAIWDPRGGLFNYLEISFDARRWKGDEVAPLLVFGYEYKHRFFDDAQVQPAFEDLQSASGELVHWLARDGFVERNDDRARKHDDPFIYSVPGVSELGSRKHYTMREEGEGAAQRLLEASRIFERVARMRNL